MLGNCRHKGLLLIAGCLLWLGSGVAVAEEQLAVIVSSQAPSIHLDRGTLRSIYLKKIFLDSAGDSLIPVNLPADHPLREAFAGAVVRMNGSQLRNYWNRRYFQGISPPYVLGSEKAVVRFVASTPGAIGYVHPCYLEPGVRTLIMLPVTLPDGADSGCPDKDAS